MVDPNTAKFINSLAKYLQMFCHGYMEFTDSIEIVGHINVRIDNSRKHDYIVNEQVSKRGQESTFFQSNSYHSLPPSKDENGEKEQRLPGKSDDSIVVNYHHMLDSPVAPLDSGLQADMSGPAPVTSASHSDDFNGTTSNSHCRSVSRDSQISLVDKEQPLVPHAQNQGFNHSSNNCAESEEMEHESAGPGDQTHSAISQAVFSDNDRPGQHSSGQNQNVIVKAEPDDQYFAPDTCDQDERFKTPSTVASTTSSILASCQQTVSSVPVAAASSSSSSLLSAHQQPAPAVLPTATASSGQLMLPASAVTYSGFSDAVEHEMLGSEMSQVRQTGSDSDHRTAVLHHARSDSVHPTPFSTTSYAQSCFGTANTHCAEQSRMNRQSFEHKQQRGSMLETVSFVSGQSSYLRQNPENKWYCSQCEKSFRTGDLLTRHKAFVHGEPLSHASSCGKDQNVGMPVTGYSTTALPSSLSLSNSERLNHPSAGASQDFIQEILDTNHYHSEDGINSSFSASRNHSGDQFSEIKVKEFPSAIQNILLRNMQTEVSSSSRRHDMLIDPSQSMASGYQSLEDSVNFPACPSGISTSQSPQVMNYSSASNMVKPSPLMTSGIFSNQLLASKKKAFVGRRCRHCHKILHLSSFHFTDHEQKCIKDRTGLDCPQCRRAFASRVALKDHVDSIHSKKVFQCRACGMTFKWRTYVYQHRYKCPAYKIKREPMQTVELPN